LLQDDKIRFKYEGVKAFPGYGGQPIGRLDVTDVWMVVLDKQVYGQYRLQAVAARVADIVRLHFWPHSKQLNFSPEVWAEVSTALHRALLQCCRAQGNSFVHLPGMLLHGSNAQVAPA
jgi:hypothetical protein